MKINCCVCEAEHHDTKQIGYSFGALIAQCDHVEHRIRLMCNVMYRSKKEIEAAIVDFAMRVGNITATDEDDERAQKEFIDLMDEYKMSKPDKEMSEAIQMMEDDFDGEHLDKSIWKERMNREEMN